jgi:hypothetical protein
MTKLDLGRIWILGWIGIYRDIWLDMDRQVMNGQIRFEDQSIVWIMGSSLSFKRAPHIMVKKESNKKIHKLFISHTPSMHISSCTDSPPARKWELKPEVHAKSKTGPNIEKCTMQKKRFTVISNLRYMYGVLNVDKIKN